MTKQSGRFQAKTRTLYIVILFHGKIVHFLYVHMAQQKQYFASYDFDVCSHAQRYRFHYFDFFSLCELFTIFNFSCGAYVGK